MALVAVAMIATSAAAQTDPGDPDSLGLSFSYVPDVTAGDSLVSFDVTFWNDEIVRACGLGVKWQGDIVMDSAVWSPEGSAAFSLFKFTWANDNIDSTNSKKLVQVTGFGTTGLAVGETTVITFYGHVVTLGPGESIVVDSSASVGWAFTDTDNSEFPPVFRGSITFTEPSAVSIGDGILPLKFALEQNYPNPFNPATTIQFDSPDRTHVNLTVYNVLGQKVTTLIDEELGPDSYEQVWDGTNEGGSHVASGIYFYRLSAGDKLETKKMMLLK
jgi:hypothetical protein